MPDGFELSCVPRRDVVVCGESLPVVVTASNADGRAAVMLGLPPTRPIEFELVGEDGSNHLRSRAIARAHADGDKARPPPVPREQTLAAGETATFDENPAAGSPVTLPPGRYQMTATMTVDGGKVLADPVEIVVESPRAGSLAALFCPARGGHGQLFTSGAGPTLLFERETGSVHAEVSVFGRCAEAGAVQDITLAQHVEPRLAGRWFAWLDERGLGATLSLGSGSVGARPTGAEVALASPRFVEPGWQRRSPTPTHPLVDGGEAVFLVTGDHEGAPHVQSFVATGPVVTPGRVVPLGGRPTSRVLARRSLQGGATRLAWAETAHGYSSIFTRSWDLDMAPMSDEPSMLFERAAPLLALEMASLDNGRAPGFVHALFGPELDEDDRRWLALVRAPLADGEPPLTMSLPVPELTPEACAVTGLPEGGFVVVAKCGIDLLAITWEGPTRWQVLATGLPDLHSLRVVSTPRGYWAAMGLDPERGIVVLPDPDFSFER